LRTAHLPRFAWLLACRVAVYFDNWAYNDTTVATVRILWISNWRDPNWLAIADFTS